MEIPTESVNFSPPLPRIVLDVLSRSRFCYLATSEENSPHLCLMCYTFIQNQELGTGSFIMSTKRATKKFAALVANSRVAVLVHDFHSAAKTSAEDSSDSSAPTIHQTSGTYSVTVYGECEVLIGDEAESVRVLHAQRNPAYRQFILGDDVSMIRVKPETARICDINDNVQTWGQTGSSSPKVT